MGSARTISGAAGLQAILDRATAPSSDAREMPKTLAVFAHPDDETVALGARLKRFAGACFVHVTDGAPRDERDSRRHGFATLAEYRQARAEELECAFQMAGVRSAQRENLGIPDQGAAHNLSTITEQLATLLAADDYEVIFTHPYEGGHPDHDACAFAVHHAVELCWDKIQPTPVIIECGFYRADTKGRNEIITDSFLRADPPTPEAEYLLSREEQQRKRDLLACFTTQRETLSLFPVSVERFRIAPEYNFREEPHLPPVLYDRYPWGTTSSRFRDLACQAEDALQETKAQGCR